MPGPTAALDEAQRAHLAAVAAALERRVEEERGWISFHDYMSFALYAPGLGYYSAGATKLGAAGDFVTAPEISDLYSQTLAAQCAQLLEQTGGEVLEVGPGSGRLAAVLLAELDADVRVSLLEVSAQLRERQRETIRALAGEAALARMRWLERLPERFTGVVLANELLDAFPVERFRVDPLGRIDRLGVVGGARGFTWSVEPAGRTDARRARYERECEQTLCALAPSLPPSYESELGIDVAPWIVAIAEMLVRGAVVLVDYGLPRSQYYHPQRMTGTLRAHFRHGVLDDALQLPGLADLTAWVDFTRVAESARSAGLEVAGFCTQAALLLAGGITERLARGAESQDAAHFARAHAVRRLLLPGEMGESVKAMVLTRGVRAPDGFALQDLRDSL